MKNLILAAVFLLAPGFCLADDHTAIVEFWKCELKDGMKMEDVEANNSKWLALARKTAGTDDIESYLLTTVVGDQTKFVFADVFPDMATWSGQKSADETEEGKAIEDKFDELLDCSDNRLYESKTTK